MHRSQPFVSDEKRLAKMFIEELSTLLTQKRPNDREELLDTLPRRVVAQWTAPGAPDLLARVIRQFENWAQRTYEGRRIAYSVGILSDQESGVSSIDLLWEHDFGVVLTDGIETLIEIGADAQLRRLILVPAAATYQAPHRFARLAGWAADDRVAVSLTARGEILLFSKGRLMFARRNGDWNYFAHDTIVRRIRIGRRALRTAVYETCLDVSFARTGGGITIVKGPARPRVGSYVEPDDRIDRARSEKAKALRQLIGESFIALPREVRQEIVALDGATILDSSGKIIAAGAIVKIPGGSSGGGRLAAAKALSNLGVAIKISSDGPIQAFMRRRRSGLVETISIGRSRGHAL